MINYYISQRITSDLRRETTLSDKCINVYCMYDMRKDECRN